MKKKKKVLFALLLLLFLEIAAVSGYEIYSILSEYRAEEQASVQLRQYIDLSGEATFATEPATEAATQAAQAPEETTAVPESTEEAPTEPVQYPAVDFVSLKQINGDVVGWIYIEGTEINYPIVQGEDNRHYVSTMADGRDNAAGSIFMDYRNTADFSDRHTVIYGHNMRNGSMFADVLQYKKQDFLETHPIGMVMTPGGNFRFEVIAGYVANVSDNAWQLDFGAEEEFYNWLCEAMAKSEIGTEAAVAPEDRILTLSTCSYEFSDARYVLVCRIIE